MASTDRDRYDRAMDYLYHFFPTLYYVIGNNSRGKEEQLGKEISLKGAVYWFGQSESKKWAVRALLLCQRVLLPGCNADATKSHFRRQGEDRVQEAIRCYLTLPHPEIERVGEVAEIPSTKLAGSVEWGTVTRETPNWNSVCYSAVLHWLFQAGFVSLVRLAKGFPHGRPPNDLLGRGEMVQGHPNWAHEFQKGEIFNFHVDGMEAQNHWGIALGGDQAVAVNNGAVRNAALERAHSLRVLTASPDHSKFSLSACANATRSLYKLDDPHAAHGHYLVIRRISPAHNEGSALANAA